MAIALGTCANCGDKIGALEKSITWENHIICQTCHAKLSTQASASTTALKELKPGEISCPFCHKSVVPVRKAKGSMAVAILLLLLFILPGVIYMVTNSGYIKACPECDTKIADA
jgi:DNA-directed RNA polymerase subunit RPC12/RpoP